MQAIEIIKRWICPLHKQRISQNVRIVRDGRPWFYQAHRSTVEARVARDMRERARPNREHLRATRFHEFISIKILRRVGLWEEYLIDTPWHSASSRDLGLYSESRLRVILRPARECNRFAPTSSKVPFSSSLPSVVLPYAVHYTIIDRHR